MDGENLAGRFEEKRGHLRAVAYRMLGSRADAEDAVQEAWLRLSRTGADGIENLGGWLTTVVGRVCLDMLRARGSRRETAIDTGDRAFPGTLGHAGHDALEHEDSLGVALLRVLDTLRPTERVAFVLHDLFDRPFEDVAAVVGHSPASARQLASRARRRVQAAEDAPEVDRTRQREVVTAFLAASREGDLQGLLALLAPGVILRADAATVAAGAEAQVLGAEAVARTFSGRARFATPALLDGMVGAVWAAGGQTRVAFVFKVVGGRVAGIDLLADPGRLAALDVAPLEG